MNGFEPFLLLPLSVQSIFQRGMLFLMMMGRLEQEKGIKVDCFFLSKGEKKLSNS